MNVHSLEVAFENIFEKISGNVELLTELDQKMGDGDLGISVKTGFQGALRSVRETEEKDVGKVLGLAADVFNRDAPSSLGTILSFFMKGMAAALNGKETFDLVELADASGN